MDLRRERDFNWAYQAKGYSRNIQGEFQDAALTEAWKTLIKAQMPVKEEGSLNIVDVGTGPGYFPILLEEMGYPCTGVDIIPEMLAEARGNAAARGVNPSFVLGDADSLPFEDGTLDVIISRNVTWTLLDAKKTYENWVRLLAPGGRIVIFDANWNYQYHNPALMESVRRDYAEFEARYGRPASANTARQDEYRRQSPMCKVRRPQWDMNVLLGLGLKRLTCDFDVTGLIWPEEKRILYHSTPMFMIVAEK